MASLLELIMLMIQSLNKAVVLFLNIKKAGTLLIVVNITHFLVMDREEAVFSPDFLSPEYPGF
jgi:hypothetical protein